MVLRATSVRRIIAAILTAGLVVVLGGSTLIYSGLYDVAATGPHWPVTRWVLETARTRSIKAHAVGVVAPPGLDNPARILIGVEHFAAHCAVCHGAPGVPKGDIARGLYPSPPDLAKAAPLYSPAEVFWILKHGIKMTGMPAWSDHSDEELWATVAFIEKLPGMSEQDYAKLVMASIAQDGHHHSDSAGHASAHSGGAATSPPKP
jgi:mono/diheme cytochrome c family protein